METELLGTLVDDNEILNAYMDMWQLISETEQSKAMDLAVRLRRADELAKTIWK